MKQREEEENDNSNGKKLRGRKPKPPVPDSQRTTKINTTDPDSRIMKSYHNDYFQGFNAQIVVSQNQYIIAADVMNDENDSNLLIPMVKQLEEQDYIPVSDSVFLTDAGYWGYSNYLAMCDCPLELLCATRKERKLSKIDGSSRFLLDLKDICRNVGTPFANRVILANIAAEFYHTFISNGEFPTPQSIARGIMKPDSLLKMPKLSIQNVKQSSNLCSGGLKKIRILRNSRDGVWGYVKVNGNLSV